MILWEEPSLQLKTEHHFEVTCMPTKIVPGETIMEKVTKKSFVQ